MMTLLAVIMATLTFLVTTSSQISSRLGWGEASASKGSLKKPFSYRSCFNLTRSKSQQPPVRLSSWRLGEVGPAGDLPEHQAAGVHVDPENRQILLEDLSFNLEII